MVTLPISLSGGKMTTNQIESLSHGFVSFLFLFAPPPRGKPNHDNGAPYEILATYLETVVYLNLL
jgi:hypothetical protein